MFGVQMTGDEIAGDEKDVQLSSGEVPGVVSYQCSNHQCSKVTVMNKPSVKNAAVVKWPVVKNPSVQV